MRRIVFLAALAALTVGAAACNQDEAASNGKAASDNGKAASNGEAPAESHAVALMMPIGGSGVEGTVRFAREGDRVLRITGKIRGLKPGYHGFHVHQYGDVTDREAGKSAGSHFAPKGRDHGLKAQDERHAGDLGNVLAGENGEATIDLTDEVLSLSGPHSIIGRALVIHADPDDGGPPTGNAGGRVAIGVIGLAPAPDEEG